MEDGSQCWAKENFMLKRVLSLNSQAAHIGKASPFDLALNNIVEGLDYSEHIWRLGPEEF
jgi:hypothetical protein|tara:strand:- start:294 stop:473 length:180 start_codon:yes stop_codon:yes gene_type:complete